MPPVSGRIPYIAVCIGVSLDDGSKPRICSPTIVTIGTSPGSISGYGTPDGLMAIVPSEVRVLTLPPIARVNSSSSSCLPILLTIPLLTSLICAPQGQTSYEYRSITIQRAWPPGGVLATKFATCSLLMNGT